MRESVRKKLNATARPTKTNHNQKLTDKQLKFAELIASGVDRYEAYEIAYERVGDGIAKYMLATYTKRLLDNPRVNDTIQRIREENEMRAKFGDIPVDKLAEIKSTQERIKEYDEKWNSKIAFEKFNSLLIGAEETLKLLKERPELFKEVHSLISQVNDTLSSLDITVDSQDDEETKKYLKDLLDTMGNIEKIIFKVGTFNVKEYNQTITTVQSLTKSINDLTGVAKNPEKLKSESFEDKLLQLISESSSGKSNKELEQNLVEFAFGEEDE